MTLFAGVFSRRAGDALPSDVVRHLAATITRHPGDVVHRVEGARGAVFHVDVGAYGAPGRVEGESSFTVLAGDPLLGIEGRDPMRTRLEDAQLLHERLSTGDADLLARAKEAFALVHGDVETGRLVLATDRIGLRPVHVWCDERWVVFATALRVLESCPGLARTLDFRSFCDVSAMGVPYAGRSPYEEIRTLRSAEIVRYDDGAESAWRYWRWDTIPESKESVDVLAERAHAVFEEAVRLRLRGDRAVPSLLSGGLDSRAIVCKLRQLDVDVHTLTFSYRDSQSADNVLSARYAEVAGTRHQVVPLPPQGSSNMSDTMAAHWSEIDWTRDENVAHPRLVWHGFDGSYSVGYVHMYAEIMTMLREGRVDDAIRYYMNRRDMAVWTRALREPFATEARDAVFRSIREAFDAVQGDDPGKRFYIQYLEHGCRGLIRSLYEEADLRRLEFHMPLMDPDLLEIVVQVPVDEAVGHRFYMRILEHMPPSMRSVPWQTYTGHVPCPLPTDDIVVQWETNDGWTRMKREVAAERLARVGAAPFPSKVLKRTSYWRARLFHALRYGNYDFAFRDVELLQQYLTHAAVNGKR